MNAEYRSRIPAMKALAERIVMLADDLLRQWQQLVEGSASGREMHAEANLPAYDDGDLFIGPVRCAACGEEWDALAYRATIDKLECPSCDSMAGMPLVLPVCMKIPKCADKQPRQQGGGQ